MNIIFCLRSKVTDNALNTDKSESNKTYYLLVVVTDIT